MATHSNRGMRRGLVLPVRLARGAIVLAAPVVLVAGLAFVRGGGVDAIAARDTRPALNVGASAQAVKDLQDGAADRLDAALAKGGSGLSFSIVQRSTVKARPGGKELRIPDPADPAKTIVVDETDAGALIEHGTATPAGFYAEIREGPAPGEEADSDARLMFQALERDDTVYRNEGKGWYETDTPPGIGLDPVTVELLGSLVRNAQAMADKGTDPADGSIRNLEGTGKVADIPGLVAADGEAFTELTDAITFGIDPDGQLAKLHLVARNTNLADYDLEVVTDISIAYAGSDLPGPKPAIKDDKAEVVP